MNSRNYLSLKTALFAICVLLSLTRLTAAGSDLKFDASFDDTSQIISFKWTLPGSPKNVRLEIYSHRGTVYLNDKFYPYRDFKSDTLDSHPIGDSTRFSASTALDMSLPATVYSKAIYPDGTTKISELVFITSKKG